MYFGRCYQSMGQPAATTFYSEHEGTSTHKMLKYMSSKLQGATLIKCNLNSLQVQTQSYCFTCCFIWQCELGLHCEYAMAWTNINSWFHSQKGQKNSSLLPRIQTDYGIHPAHYSVIWRAPSPETKRSGWGANIFRNVLSFKRWYKTVTQLS